MTGAAASWCLACVAVLVWPARGPLPSRARRITDAGRFARRGATARWSMPAPENWPVATAVALAIVPLAGIALGLAAGAAGHAVRSLVVSARSQRAERVRRTGLQRAVSLLAAELTAGSRPDAAVRAAAEVSPDHAASLHALADAHARGLAASTAVTAPDLAGVARAWDAAAASGAPLAAVLERVSAEVAASIDRERRVEAALAGPRASALMLAGLPLLGLGLGAALGVRPLHVLFGAASGRLLCCTGVLLDVAGVLWTERILRSVRRP